MCLALCQINSVSGNVRMNLDSILKTVREVALNTETEFLVFPEMALPGACAADLLLSEQTIEACETALSEIDALCRSLNVTALVGTVRRGREPGKLRNSLSLVGIGGGGRFEKMTLFSNDVSDDHRYFEPDAALNCVWMCPKSGLKYAISHWADRSLLALESFHGANVDRVVLVSAAPFELGCAEEIYEELRDLAANARVPLIYVNAIGGGDHVVFSGGSCVMTPDGRVPVSCGWFAESCQPWMADIDYDMDYYPRAESRIVSPAQSTIDALTCGLTDYMRKCGFRKVIFGNSGGIDSAVVGALAVRALGADNVISVSMPGPYTTEGTRTDSDILAERLGIKQLCVPILKGFEAFQYMMFADDERAPVKALFAHATDVNKLANENLQARLRGTTLMWITNALGGETPTLLLATGNKSEAAAGYATLYGDTCGGLSLIGDLTKGMVYDVARELNRELGDVIPSSVIDRAPSAELAPGQKDQDSLPPYPCLDHLVRNYVEEGNGPHDVIGSFEGVDEHMAHRVHQMINNAEFKRKQVAACIRVTKKAFGSGRRMPLAKGKA